MHPWQIKRKKLESRRKYKKSEKGKATRKRFVQSAKGKALHQKARKKHYAKQREKYFDMLVKHAIMKNRKIGRVFKSSAMIDFDFDRRSESLPGGRGVETPALFLTL